MGGAYASLSLGQARGVALGLRLEEHGCGVPLTLGCEGPVLTVLLRLGQLYTGVTGCDGFNGGAFVRGGRVCVAEEATPLGKSSVSADGGSGSTCRASYGAITEAFVAFFNAP